MAAEFNKILKKNRKRLGITQEELAKKIQGVKNSKVEKTYLSRLESENSNPRFSTIEKLCNGLGMTFAEFFGGAEEETRVPAILVSKMVTAKEEDEKYRIKAEMCPIKVFKSLDAFARNKDIRKEFASKYIYIEKTMFDTPENIVAAEIDGDYIFSTEAKFNKPIFLIDIVEKKIATGGYFVVHPSEKFGTSIQKVQTFSQNFLVPEARTMDESIALIEPQGKSSNRVNHLFKKEDFDYDIIRGKIVGVLSRYEHIAPPSRQ